MKRAVLMSRVSSDEQAKGYSLDIQVEKLCEHCRKENIAVCNIYREDHSAKNFNRPEFKRLLHYLKGAKGKVDLLLVTTWDRFSRNLTESFSMIEQLRTLGVEVQAIDQPLDLSVPENLMILSVYLALPDIDNKRRSIKITEGVRAGKASGRWMGLAPFGYKNSRDEQNRPVIVPSEKAGVVRQIFTALSRGKSQSEIQLVLKKQGITLQRSTLSDLIRNPVYTGKIWVKSEGGGGYYVKGIHEPLIDEQTFEKAQAAIGVNIQRKNITVAKAFKEELPLRGLLLCPSCGEKLTGSASKSRNGSRHHYYHCNHCGKERIKAGEAHERVENLLGELQVTKEATKLYEAMVRKLLQGKEKSRRPVAVIDKEIEQFEARLKNIEDDLADRAIDPETFHRTKARYAGEIQKRKEERNESGSEKSDLKTLLRKGIHALEQLPSFYQKGSLQTKRDVLGSIFPEKLSIGKEKCRTTRLNEAVLLIAATDKGFAHKKTGQPFKNLELSGQVDLTGKKSNQIWELLERIYALKPILDEKIKLRVKQKNGDFAFSA